MTAEDLAKLLDARRSGRGWVARCPVPSHKDHSPSLSIRQGHRGVLIHCFRSCSLNEILAALKLSWRDLFSGPPPSPEQARRAALERQQREDGARMRRIAHVRACDRLQALERIAEELGAKLPRMPDDAPEGDALTTLFHGVLDRIRAAEVRELELRP